MTNVWIPDGQKDTPADRKSPRDRLTRSLDEIFATPINPALVILTLATVLLLATSIPARRGGTNR